MEGAWFVPEFPRGGGREGRSDVWETEGAQSALARGLETAARRTALSIVSPVLRFFNYNSFLFPPMTPRRTNPLEIIGQSLLLKLRLHHSVN